MKRLLLPLSLLVCLLAVGCGTNRCHTIAVQEEFTKGQAAYEMGDYEQAFAILKPLALDGHVDAQYYVGVMYNNGLGTNLYTQEGALLLNYAARQGQINAMYALAGSYNTGLGVMPNPDMTAYWLTRCAEGVYMGLNGWGYNADKESSQYFSTSAWRYGAWKPGEGYFVSRYWFHAVNPGTTDELMLYSMARNYQLGGRVEQDLAKAHNMYQVLAAAENPYQADAQYELGMMYLTGHGVDQDVDASRGWLQMAASQGHEQAAYELQQLGN